MKSTLLISRAALLVLFVSSVAFGVGNEVDPSFGPQPTKELTGPFDGRLAVQPDGKVVIFGSFQIVNGAFKGTMARLNVDGTLDTSFTYGGNPSMSISSVVFQPDGKILIAGSPLVGYQLARLNSDGSLDGSFAATDFVQGAGSSGGVVYAVQSDGKILATRDFIGPFLDYTVLYRVNTNGTLDSGFTTLSFNHRIPKEFLKDLISLPDGKILIGGSHFTAGASRYVFRLNSNGTIDPTFESPLLTNSAPGGFPVVTNIAMQSTGKVLFTGYYSTVNGLNRTNLTRLNGDGTLDQLFPLNGYSGQMEVVSGDRIILGNNVVNGLVRLLADGAVDGTFVTPTIPYGTWAVDNLERIDIFAAAVDGINIVYKFLRFNTDGSYDLSFAPSARKAGTVFGVAAQPDGKVIISGDFTKMNGVTKNTIARVNSDGTIDPTFDCGLGFNTPPNTLVVQPDGKIIVAGPFQTFNGDTHPEILRLNSNGTLDTGFNPNVDNDVTTVVLQNDGKILIGGSFITVNAVGQIAVARLNSDGTVDGTFNPIFSTAMIYAIVYHSATGKVLIGGTFSGVSGVARTNLALLNSNGSVDSSFNAGSIASVALLAPTNNGKYMVYTQSALKRFNADGSTDIGFVPPTVPSGSGFLNAMVVQADGSVIVGGRFSTVNNSNRPNFARFTSTGSLDTPFFPTGANEEVVTLATQPDGRILVGGLFNVIGAVQRAGIARISTVPIFRPTNFDYDGDGKADISVYRPSTNYWYITQSSDSAFTFTYFGAAGDIAAPGDYDGDGKTDIAIFRPSTGDWWYKSSLNGTFRVQHWGESTDVPIPEDFDGDGRTDFVVYRPSINRWYRLSSATLAFSEKYFGAAGDKPVIADFDGDGKFDPTIFRPSTGTFWYMSAIDNIHRAIQWGTGTDVPTPADFDGDGRSDAAVYRPSTGFWYIYYTGTNTYSFTQFGVAEDKTVVADYDGDGKADIAVYRPSIGTWYLLRSSAGFIAFQFGNSTDVPTPNTIIPQ